MSYHFSKRLDVPFEQAVSRVSHRGAETRGLRGAYGYRCERNAESEAWRGLSSLQNPRACNPQLAHRALQFEDKIGAMLPCNVIVQQHADGTAEVLRRRSGRLYASDRKSALSGGRQRGSR